MNYIKDFQLKDNTTFHLPVKCDYFVEYSTIAELKEILHSQLYRENKTYHIGGGSNLVFTQDFKGFILHSKIEFIKVIEESDDAVVLEVGSGNDWDEFVAYCTEAGYYGIENLSYIPGEVGASAVQNIGSYGVEVKEVISEVRSIDTRNGNSRIFTNEECNYGYRESIFKNELKDKYIVTSVVFRLSKTPKFNLEYGPLKSLGDGVKSLTLQNVRNTIIEVRTSKLPDPKYIGSAGSFFKNPVVAKEIFEQIQKDYPQMPYYVVTTDTIKIPAGWLIENSGLKGYTIGGAQVYEKQCLVIINKGDATPTDVVNLYTYIVDKVKEKFDIQLSLEANII